jgi:hypothetical protein
MHIRKERWGFDYRRMAMAPRQAIFNEQCLWVHPGSSAGAALRDFGR